MDAESMHADSGTIDSGEQTEPRVYAALAETHRILAEQWKQAAQQRKERVTPDAQ